MKAHDRVRDEKGRTYIVTSVKDDVVNLVPDDAPHTSVVKKPRELTIVQSSKSEKLD